MSCSAARSVTVACLITLLTTTLALIPGCGDESPRQRTDAAPTADAVSDGPVITPDGPTAARDGAPPQPDGATPGDGPQAPTIEFLGLVDGGTYANQPDGVLFRVRAPQGTAEVTYSADGWQFGSSQTPGDDWSLRYTFSNLGQRKIEAVAFDGGSAELARTSITITVEAGSPPPGTPGSKIATMWTTYYYLAVESDYSGPDDTTLYDASCKAITSVPAAYSDDVCIEGSGQLADGRVINYAKSCSCGRPCPTGGTICYAVLDKTKFPWGMGAKSNALEPLRSLAVDKSVLPLGTVLYLKEWDGVTVPKVGTLGGFVHDGCFRADDVGGAINGYHFDFFAGSHAMWKKLETIFATKSNFTVHHGGTRCAHLAP
jgi:3D (Asp-Asp-Asp) domain-containing protein